MLKALKLLNLDYVEGGQWGMTTRCVDETAKLVNDESSLTNTQPARGLGKEFYLYGSCLPVWLIPPIGS